MYKTPVWLAIVLPLAFVACTRGSHEVLDAAVSTSAVPPTPRLPPDRKKLNSGRFAVCGVWSTRVRTSTSSEPIPVRDWLKGRNIDSSHILGGSVPPSWLSPRMGDPEQEPECFSAFVGQPAQDGLICRHPVVGKRPEQRLQYSEELYFMMYVTVWRIEENVLRRVLEVRTGDNPDVCFGSATCLLIESYHHRPKEWEDVVDEVYWDFWEKVNKNGGIYEWKDLEFVQTEHPSVYTR